MLRIFLCNIYKIILHIHTLMFASRSYWSRGGDVLHFALASTSKWMCGCVVVYFAWNSQHIWLRKNALIPKNLYTLYTRLVEWSTEQRRLIRVFVEQYRSSALCGQRDQLGFFWCWDMRSCGLNLKCICFYDELQYVYNWFITSFIRVAWIVVFCYS